MRLSKKNQKLILDRMIALIERPYGWTKGTWRRERKDGVVQYCLLGAAQQAYFEVTGKIAKGDGGNIADAISLSTFVKEHTPSSSVMSYNDRKGTRKADVLNLLRNKRKEMS
jgi:hypothetical protein